MASRSLIPLPQRTRTALRALPFVLSTLPAAAQSLGETQEKGDRVGAALASGDFNADGLDDLAIGVPGESVQAKVGLSFQNFPGAGAIHVVRGSPVPSPFDPGLAGPVMFAQGATAPLPTGIAVGNAFGSALAAADFNGDGFCDLAVGVPGQTVSGLAGAGSVIVFFGSAGGLRPKGTQTWTQSSVATKDASEAGDAFGASLCAGDFNGDGIADLAVGAPNEDLGAFADAGVVTILHGSATGLSNAAAVLLKQTSGGLDAVESGDRFGSALGAGDFDGDGFDELAVAAVGEDLGAIADAGAVSIFRGSSTGVSISGVQLWHQDVAGMNGVAEAADELGFALHGADFDSDGRDDLAIGVPGEITGGVRGGAAQVLFGSAAGLGIADNVIVTEGVFPVFDVIEEGDRFGAALGAWDIDGNGTSNLVVGVPGQTVNSKSKAGAAHSIGLQVFRAPGSDLYMQAGTTFFGDTPLAGAALGSAIASGEFSGDTWHELAVGVPGWSIQKLSLNIGAVDVVYPTSFRNDHWIQNP